MPFLCLCGSFPVKSVQQRKQKNNMLSTDFRRADRQFVSFVPKTCADAIDLFTRHRDMGLNPDMYPECFVHCARALPDKELDKFHRFIINPNGDIEKGGEAPSIIDLQLEKEREQLLLEATKRDSVALVIPEEDDEEEKTLIDDDFRREPCSLESLQEEKTCCSETPACSCSDEKEFLVVSNGN